jgi:hypothetical protein
MKYLMINEYGTQHVEIIFAFQRCHLGGRRLVMFIGIEPEIDTSSKHSREHFFSFSIILNIFHRRCAISIFTLFRTNYNQPPYAIDPCGIIEVYISTHEIMLSFAPIKITTLL